MDSHWLRVKNVMLDLIIWAEETYVCEVLSFHEVQKHLTYLPFFSLNSCAESKGGVLQNQIVKLLYILF